VGQVILITGGSRSGKSTYALKLAESITGSRTYIATCPPVDAEMVARIQIHQEQRQSARWQTIEETIDIADALRKTRESQVRLIDCLTLWINNLIYEAEKKGKKITEDNIAERCTDIFCACEELPGTVIFITNEVGMGIIPNNALSKYYRNIAGCCNQIIAAGADRVILMVSGLPMVIKPYFPEKYLCKT
jgi:adenosylcobinamide kinase / adenosylcobinamide-phosphate guanylyltransferase